MAYLERIPQSYADRQAYTSSPPLELSRKGPRETRRAAYASYEPKSKAGAPRSLLVSRDEPRSSRYPNTKLLNRNRGYRDIEIVDDAVDPDTRPRSSRTNRLSSPEIYDKESRDRYRRVSLSSLPPRHYNRRLSSPTPPAAPEAPSPPPAQAAATTLRRRKSILIDPSARGQRGRSRRRSPSPTPSTFRPDPAAEAIRTRQRSRGRSIANAIIDKAAPLTPSLRDLSRRRRDLFKRDGGSKQYRTRKSRYESSDDSTDSEDDQDEGVRVITESLDTIQLPRRSSSMHKESITPRHSTRYGDSFRAREREETKTDARKVESTRLQPRRHTSEDRDSQISYRTMGPGSGRRRILTTDREDDIDRHRDTRRSDRGKGISPRPVVVEIDRDRQKWPGGSGGRKIYRVR